MARAGARAVREDCRGIRCILRCWGLTPDPPTHLVAAQESEMESKKLRERMKIVEEALRAMRDEAREHVLAIKSSDIVLNRLLGSGSFAEGEQMYLRLSADSRKACLYTGVARPAVYVPVRVIQVPVRLPPSRGDRSLARASALCAPARRGPRLRP